MRERNANLIDVAPVSMACLAACIIYFVYLAWLGMSGQYGESGIWGVNGDLLRDCGASFREGVWDGGWHRFVLPMFMHGGLLHIVFNMLWLYRLGPTLEMHFGPYNFGSIYFLSGLGCICLSQIFGGGTSVGASGCVFGMLGALLAIRVAAAYDLRRALRSSEVRDTAFYIGLLFFICFFIPHVDHWGHLGGLILGFLYGWLFESWRKRKRIGLAVVLALVALTASGVAACRWMVFNPHYHVHMGIVAEIKGNPEEADRHFNKAIEWSKLWRSENAMRELYRQQQAAREKGEYRRAEKFNLLLYFVAPRKYLKPPS
jgi:membrane associated rhomboid family serine protease